MIRWILVLLFLLSVGTTDCAAQAPTTTAESPSATSAKQAFDQLQKQWVDSIVQLQKKSQEKSGSSKKDQNKHKQEIEELREKTEEMVDKIVDAGLAVHRAGMTDDSTVNSTLVAIAGFYVAGDSNGDGGDQYEKALPLIKSMLQAGLGNTSKELWLWGGVSAFCLNDFDLAKTYFDSAQQANLLADNPPSANRNDPRNRVWQLAKSQSKDLAATQQSWQKEEKIRSQEAAADNLPRVKFKTTRGDIVIELFENEAPQAVASFISLVKDGYYDGIVFHRVLPAFMAQGGDPTGTGSGGPGYNIRCECYTPKARKHFRGSLSMAHAGRNTGGSQFFLTFVPTSYLDGRHTVFGRVVAGMDAAASLKRRNPQAPGPKPTPDKIVQAQVLRDRGHEYKFEKLPAR